MASLRPLVDELGARLYPRLARASRDHEDVLMRVITAVPPGQSHAFAATLATLDDDPMLAHLWSEHLVIAWCCYTAAVSPARDAPPALPPRLAGTASSETWRAWLRRVRGEHREIARPAPRGGDYIMAVG